MMQLVLYDNWMEEANKKVDGKTKMSKMQIKEIVKLCVTADKVEFVPGGTLYQIK